MSVPGYSAWSVTAGSQPTTAYWNILGSNDAAFNTFLSNQNILSTLLALSSGFSGGVASQTNAGTAGGTMWWINLGGIKILWGVTATLTINTNNLGITFPTFFTSIQLPALANVSQIGGSWAQYASTANTSTTGFILGVNGGGTTAVASYIVIGT